ncbi:hypothetical protein GH714_032657 [Hevea brasiliensis]|uniref:TF-B3 domain-containing protein n=1 Tax=Hevea brasiliensis TaxID=3981 RepID=A0A6A6NE09_HEVBR|nr:hypothetical protein GH714_032657 [Hevea brasiliensis]
MLKKKGISPAALESFITLNIKTSLHDEENLLLQFPATKAEEEAEAARNAQHHVTRTIVEMKEFFIPPRIEPSSPWQIRRPITRNEVAAGELVLSHEEMFEHVFRFWNLDSANHVVQGNKCFVVLIDYTEDNMPKTFQGAYVKSCSNDTYVVGMMEVVRGRVINPGDEIGLFWDMRPATYGFAFKLLRRGNSIS